MKVSYPKAMASARLLPPLLDKRRARGTMRLEDEYNMEATPDANVVQMVGRTADEAVPAVTEAAAEVMEIQDVMAGGQTGSFRERQSKGRAGPEQLLGLM